MGNYRPPLCIGVVQGIARPQSQFPHSGVCERFIYSHDRSAYSAAGNTYVDRSWEYINRLHVEIGTEAAQFPVKEYINGIFVAVTYMGTPMFFGLFGKGGAVSAKHL